MDFALRFQHFVLLSAILAGSALGLESLRALIPNGHLVPHPCNPEYLWREPGHENRYGGGEMNQFGDDFEENDMTWDEAICKKDSDGDGKSNGVELGDPDCKWTPEAQPEKTTGLSHPGVCEPLDSADCAADYVDCEDLCSGLHEDGVTRHTVTMSTPVSVPSKTWVHACMVFNYPTNNDYHIVSVAPHLQNSDLDAHILVFSCDGNNFPERPDLVHTCHTNTQCGMDTFHLNMGYPDVCLYHEAGIRVGNHTKGIKRGLLRLDLYNPGDETVEDKSGIDIFLTPNRRPYDAAMLYFGQKHINIPPGKGDYKLMGGCSPSCTKKKMSGPINITAAFNQMNYAGVSAISQWITKEPRVNYIGYDEKYNVTYPTYHSFEEPLQINPGDRLNIECHYDSTKRNRTTRLGGNPMEDETCYGSVMYYPAENMALSSCKAYGDLDTCDFEDDVIRGCDLRKQNFSDTKHVPEFLKVQKDCAAEICRYECKKLLKRVKHHPCYSSSLGSYLIEHIDDVRDKTQKINMLSFWLKMSSCDHELAMDEASKMNNAAIKPFSQSAVPISVILMLVLALFN